MGERSDIRCIAAGVSLIGLAHFCHGASEDAHVSAFSPLTSEVAALSPDGRRLAYSVRTGDQISILTLDVDSPSRATSEVAVAKDEYASGYMQADRPARITSISWTPPSRILVESNLVFLSTRKDLRGVIFGFDFNGTNARIIYSARAADGPVQLLGPMANDSNQLLVRADRKWLSVDATNGYAHDLGESEFNSTVRAIQTQYDRAIRLNLGSLARLRSLYPGYTVEMLPHFGASRRILTRVSSLADAGSFVVFDPDQSKAWDMVGRAPALSAASNHRIEPFDITDEHGRKFTGTLVLPRNPRIRKAPLVLWLTRPFGTRADNQFQPEVAVLASMGLAVAVVDGLVYRSSQETQDPDETSNFRAPEFLATGSASPPRSIAPRTVSPDLEIEHQLLACRALSQHFPVSAKAVALFGEDATAFLALKAIVAHPQTVRCIVALDPAFDRLNRTETSDLMRSIRNLPIAPCGAVFLRVPTRTPSGRREAPDLGPTRAIASALMAKGPTVELAHSPRRYTELNATAKAATFRDIEKFLAGC